MTTITIQLDDTTKIQKVLNFFKRSKVSFQISEPTLESELLWDSQIHSVIQQRLFEKYITTDKWENMNDEERQDASQVEKMLWQREQSDYHVYSEAETKDYLTQLKKELYEVS